MQSIIQSDIFFFITAISVVVITAGLVVLGVYIWRILRDTREIVGRVKDMSAEVEQDFNRLRADVREEGSEDTSSLATRYLHSENSSVLSVPPSAEPALRHGETGVSP